MWYRTPGKVLDTPATHQNHRVLLEIVPDARNVGRNLDPGGQAHPGHLA
jgi:hypothetical protein